jgi:hypothetical protein
VGGYSERHASANLKDKADSKNWGSMVSVHRKNRASYRRTQFILIPYAERPSAGSRAAVRLIKDRFPQWPGQPSRERILMKDSKAKKFLEQFNYISQEQLTKNTSKSIINNIPIGRDIDSFSMSNINANTSKINYNFIWIISNILNELNIPEIRIGRYYNQTISISITDFKIISNNNYLFDTDDNQVNIIDIQLLDNIKSWIDRNRNILLQYWNGEIDDSYFLDNMRQL